MNKIKEGSLLQVIFDGNPLQLEGLSKRLGVDVEKVRIRLFYLLSIQRLQDLISFPMYRFCEIKTKGLQPHYSINIGSEQYCITFLWNEQNGVHEVELNHCFHYERDQN